VTAVGPDVGSSEVVGRQGQLGRLRTLIDRAPVQGQVLVLLGEAGIGKSTLLASAAQEARAAGMRVLWATGRESETNIAFAGLHRLLSPVLGAAADLERRQARALLGALGLAGEPAAADLLGTGLATLTLLSDSSAPAPVLVIVDDAHWLDRSTLDILAFAGSRM
jgi:predicted ATPase